MIDTIFVAVSGLRGFSNGLRVIAHNTANLNSPGFKGSRLLFADMFQGQGGTWGTRGSGYGMTTLSTLLNFQQGQLQSTGNGLDLAIDGQGLFVLRDSAGNVHFTRDGQFRFDENGVLVSSTTGEQVLAYDGAGNLSPVSIASARVNDASVTTRVAFSGNLSSTATTFTVGGVRVIDAAGSAHTLSVRLDAVAGTPGSWTVTVLDGTTTVGTGTVRFVSGRPDPAAATISVTYTPPGQSAMTFALDFSANVTSFDSGSMSTLVMASQNGYPPGSLTGVTFDATGAITMAYSNGQTVRGGRLALGRFNSEQAVRSIGNNEFEAVDGLDWLMGVAGDQGFGQVKPGMVEASNVDLSQEFSDLVIVQRGYQACSQVVSTANEMLTELFGMRGK